MFDRVLNTLLISSHFYKVWKVFERWYVRGIKRYDESNDYLSDEGDNFLADINGELVTMFCKEYFC